MPDGNGTIGQGTTGGATGNQGNQGAAGSDQGNQGNQSPNDFEAWLEAHPDGKPLYEAHTKGLNSALVAERAGRKEEAARHRAELQDAITKTQGEAQQKLQEALEANQELETRSSFMEEAIRPEIGCIDATAAYWVALEMNAINDKGKIDWGALKEQHPSLFRSKVANANAGAGTQGLPVQKVDMNSLLRKAAGRE